MPVALSTLDSVAVSNAAEASPEALGLDDTHRARRGRYCVGTFGGRREQVGQARAFLAAFLGNWERTDDAVLLIGELGANAVVHNRPRPRLRPIDNRCCRLIWNSRND